MNDEEKAEMHRMWERRCMRELAEEVGKYQHNVFLSEDDATVIKSVFEKWAHAYAAFVAHPTPNPPPNFDERSEAYRKVFRR